MNSVSSPGPAFSFLEIRDMVMGALMAALMAAGAFIVVPIGPVPIVLQNLFVMLAGLILGAKWGMASVGIYLLAGLLGFPVFSGGGAGHQHLLGPTGGYLLGYLPAVLVIGLVSGLGKRRSPSMQGVLDVAAMILGAAVIYAVGVLWLKAVLELTLAKAAAVGMAPFLLGDILKIAAAVPIAASARRLLSRYDQEP